jgi:transmembrane sensor
MTAPEHDIESLRAQAADWFVRVQSDAATGDDWLALEAWLSESDAHRTAFEDVELLWSELDDQAGRLRGPIDDRSAEVVLLPLADRRGPPPRLRAPVWAAMAAVLLIAVGAGLWLQRPPAETVFTTAKGETRAIRLADGSAVELNSDTRLLARVSRSSRNLVLVKGEALFDVVKDSGHPFRVTAGDQRITVVGTQFDVLKYRGEVSVTVSRGVVEVADVHAGPEAEVRLAVGDQLRRKDGSSQSILSRARLDDVMAWRKGYLVYRDQPLGEVAADLDRFLPTPITVDASAANLRFSGALRLSDEDAMLGALQRFLPVEAVRSAEHIQLRSKSPHR